MRRCLAPLAPDASLIVHKRLPWTVRKEQLRRQLWRQEEKEQEISKPAGIVVQIAQAAHAKRRQPQLWSNLLEQALAVHAELTPQDMANVLWSMSEVRYQHYALLDEFVRSLSLRADVKAMVTAMLAVDKLGLPIDTLRAPFVQQLSGQCEELSFGDLRRVLMALARCWQRFPIDSELLDELCATLLTKSQNCDPRDLVAVPQHLGRLRYLHPGLIAASSSAVWTIVSSRLTVVPLDVFRALDGFLLLSSIVDTAEPRVKLFAMADKCGLFATQLLRLASIDELWSCGQQLMAAEIVEPRAWIIWAKEAIYRRTDDLTRAQQIARIRSRIRRQWRVAQPPESFEVALRGMLHETA